MNDKRAIEGKERGERSNEVKIKLSAREKESEGGRESLYEWVGEWVNEWLVEWVSGREREEKGKRNGEAQEWKRGEIDGEPTTDAKNRENDRRNVERYTIFHV